MMGVAFRFFVCYNAPKEGIPILAQVRTLGLFFGCYRGSKNHFAEAQSIFKI